MARPWPVFPDVGSTSVPPGFSSPAFSAASIIRSPMRSFTLPPGFSISSFARTVAWTPAVVWRSRTSGVFPMASRNESRTLTALFSPAAAFRYVPPSAQVRPEDRHYVETLPTAPSDGSKKTAAGEKSEQARKRYHRIVWVKENELLRAVPVTLGLIENQYAELLEGNLHEGDEVVTGTESAIPAR